jgi:hypothetical protein
MQGALGAPTTRTESYAGGAGFAGDGRSAQRGAPIAEQRRDPPQIGRLATGEVMR